MSVLCMASYVSIVVSRLLGRGETDWIIDLMLATIPSVFQDIYHFETQYTGLAYLGRKS